MFFCYNRVPLDVHVKVNEIGFIIFCLASKVLFVSMLYINTVSRRIKQIIDNTPDELFECV